MGHMVDFDHTALPSTFCAALRKGVLIMLMANIYIVLMR